MASARDIAIRITSPNATAERRITPSWSLATLKVKLEPVTGIPPGSQRLTLKVPGASAQVLDAADEESTQLSHWSLVAQAEIQVRHKCIEYNYVCLGSFGGPSFVDFKLHHVTTTPEMFVNKDLKFMQSNVLPYSCESSTRTLLCSEKLHTPFPVGPL